ncbi:MAG: hypothetical protein QNJ09_17540 [Paracoccaceae bacterium]|nr:hypothetical protein [Paracoccaceae bacterium]
MGRTALLLRSHVMNDLVVDFYRQAERLKPAHVDVILCCDETNGTLPIPDGMRAFRHSTADIEPLGLLPFLRHKMLWYNGDYPIYFFFDQNPDYDLYLLIEYDVYFTDKALTQFFAHIDATRADFFGVNIHLAPSHWKWTEAALQYHDKAYGTFFPIIGLSNTAVATLFANRQRQAQLYIDKKTTMWTHCEAYVPTEAMAAGFRCHSLERSLNLPKSAFGTTTLGCAELLDRSEDTDLIRHPVLPAPDFLAKLIFVAGGTPLDVFLQARPRFIGILSRIDGTVLEEALNKRLGPELVARVQALIPKDGRS